MKKIITTTLILGFSSLLIADANIPMDKKAMKEKLAKIAGEPSPFNKNEDFPKEYFLIPHNLPFALALVLHHPQSSTLNLTKEQITKLVEMGKTKKPTILKKAKEIKDMELSLLKMIETNEGNQTKVSDKMSKIVDTIATQKAELTKAHLQCLIDVQNVLTKEQREKVMAYATMKKVNKAKVVTENNTTKEKVTVENNTTKTKVKVENNSTKVKVVSENNTTKTEATSEKNSTK